MTGPRDGSRAATAADAGRTCPYCHFAVKDGAPVVDCHVCAAIHHSDCWHDNHGCAIAGCTGVAAPVSAPASAAPAPAPTPAGGGGGRNGALVAAIAVLCVVIAAAAAVLFVALSSDDQSPPTVTVSKTVRQAATPAPDPPEPTPAAAARSSTPTARIQALIESYYSAVRARRFSAAWALLSSTYTSWKAGNGGFALWRQQESRNADRLRFTHPRVTVRELDTDSGVATIHVSGMGYAEPDGSICRYEGITWARLGDDGWRYDQGYLQDPARTAKWRPRRSETLGYACDESGY